MAYGSLGRTGQQFNEFLLIRGLDREDIDDRDKLAVRRDRRHTQTRGSVVKNRNSLTTSERLIAGLRVQYTA